MTEVAIAELGAGTASLGEADASKLDDQGYLVLPGALDPPSLARLRSRFDELVAEEGERAGLEVHQEPGTSRLANLVDKDPLFDRCWNHPMQLAAIAHVLGGRELVLSSLNGRCALPGQGHQALHTDWPGPVRPGAYQACNSIWMLDDFTLENGATRVVPGSQRSGQIPSAAMADPAERHVDEVLLTGPAGTCVVFNAHLWHGGTRNGTDRPRRALYGYFTCRGNRQQTVQSEHLRPATLARLSWAQRYLLEV